MDQFQYFVWFFCLNFCTISRKLRRRKMVSKGCFKCTKYFLFVDSIVIWLIGCAVLGFSLWFYLDPHRNFMLDIVNTSEGDPLLQIAVIILISMGCLTIFIGILGCYGTLREAPCLLIGFLIFLTIAIVGQIAAGSLAAVFKSEIDEQFQDKYRYRRDGGSLEFFWGFNCAF